jgi:tetratricopeptide (TPR) repeat protein
MPPPKRVEEAMALPLFALLSLVLPSVRCQADEATDKRDEADRVLVQKLDEIRLQTGTKDKASKGDAYAAAFQSSGIDVLALTPEAAAAKIKERTHRIELAAALDEWADRIEKEADRKRLREAVRLVDPEPLRLKVRDALDRKDVKALKETAATRDVLDQPPSLLVRLARGLSVNGAAAEAATLLKAAQRLHPGDFWINYELGQLLTLQAASSEEAVRYATAALALRPDSPAVQLSLAAALTARGKLDEAVEHVRQTIRLKPDATTAHSMLGDLLRAQGKVDEAIVCYREALRLDPAGETRARVGLGTALAEKGKLDDAEVLFQDAVRLQPSSIEAQRGLAAVLFRKTKYKESEAILRKLLETDPGSADVRIDLGVLLMQQGKPSEALEMLQAAVKAKPDHVNAHMSLGNILRTMGKPDDAMVQYRDVIRLQSNAVNAHLALAEILREKGNFQESAAAYRSALTLKPDNSDAWNGLGATFRAAGANADAMTAFRKAIELKPDSAPAHCNLGLCLIDQGSFKEALEALKRGHELGSKQPSWRYPSSEWVKQAEHLIELDAKLPDVLKGDAKPASAREAVELAELCHRTRRLHGTAAKMFAQAFQDDPKLTEDPSLDRRFSAAGAAAMAAMGAGKDADQFDDKTRLAMRLQAQEWLKEDLALWRKGLDDARSREAARRAVQRWLTAPELAGVRDKANLERLPAEERKDWQKLWAEAAEVMQAAGGKK